MRISDWSSDVCSSDLLRAAVAQRRDWKLECRSIVFPRNQYADRHLDICAAEGLTAFRGAELSWMYRPGNLADQSLLRRAARLADTYLPLSGSNAVQPLGRGRMLDVPRSEEPTSELQSLMRLSYAVFCLKKKHLEEENTTE